MPASEIRKDARESLKGKWGKALCIVLVYVVFTFVLGFIQGLFSEKSIFYMIMNIAVFIISVPISFGLTISFMKLKRSENVSAFDFFKEGFSRFAKSWGIWLHTFLKLLLPIICVVLVILLMSGLMVANTVRSSTSENTALTLVCVALYIVTLVYGVSRGLLYSLAYYIGYDNPELSSKECVAKSEDLMRGNRGNIFLLELSFIGWAILAVLSLGIGILWLYPYMQISLVCFYERVAKIDTKNEGPIEPTEVEE